MSLNELQRLATLCSTLCVAPFLQEHSHAVPSLGWVTPGAATIRVSPLYFFLKNLATFFSRQFYGVTPVYFLLKN